VVHLPVQQNLHRDGILAVTQVPAPDVDPARAAEAVALLRRRLAEGLHYVGVLCVEFFVLADGSPVANEMAPRPHNSGHYSLDACDLSQFELQVRTWPACRWWRRACTRRPSCSTCWATCGSGRGRRAGTRLGRRAGAARRAHLHLYGKAEARRAQDGPPDRDRPRRP
jgi:5-(carboxyamino)imidazole ribonucleotide synthase